LARALVGVIRVCIKNAMAITVIRNDFMVKKRRMGIGKRNNNRIVSNSSVLGVFSIFLLDEVRLGA
jgi:hypothetical protein